jgi:hypothetical protein
MEASPLFSYTPVKLLDRLEESSVVVSPPQTVKSVKPFWKDIGKLENFHKSPKGLPAAGPVGEIFFQKYLYPY